MSSTARRKGSQFERDIRNYIDSRGFKVINPGQTGFEASDAEVTLSCGILTVECKNRKTRSFPSWFRQVQKDSENGIFAVASKHYGKGKAEDQFLTLTNDAAQMLLDFDVECEHEGGWSGHEVIYKSSRQVKNLEEWIKEFETDNWILIHDQKKDSPLGNRYATMRLDVFLTLAEKWKPKKVSGPKWISEVRFDCLDCTESVSWAGEQEVDCSCGAEYGIWQEWIHQTKQADATA